MKFEQTHRPRTSALSILALGLTLLLLPSSQAQTDQEFLGQWLTAQEHLTSWSAELVQTRHLPSLTRPLTAPGRVWFTAPDRFRWELGQPAQSIAVRSGNDLLLLSPRLKRGERYPLGRVEAGPMKNALALLDTGFPRDAAEFRKRFELLSVNRTNALLEFRVRPRAASARNLMPGLTLWVATNSWNLTATELQFTDGSRMRNDFTNALNNPRNDPALFTPLLDATWKISEPSRQP